MTVLTEHRLERAFAACAMITRQRARNFYYGLKLLPEPQRSALYAMYAWMRQADDLTDVAGTLDGSAPDPRRERIEAFRSATDAALAGDPVDDDPVWIALPAIVSRFSIRVEHLHSMLDGQLHDLDVTSYQTFEQLRQYCYHVASTVGLICVTIWGYDDSRAEGLAVDRGVAFQLTNILRDFRQDFDAGRVYLPLEDFERHGFTPADLRSWRERHLCERFVAHQVDRAQSYYERSGPLESMITASCRPTLWAMSEIYRRLLGKVRSRPQAIVGTRRIRLGAIQKGAIALQARGMRGWSGNGKA